MPTAPTNIIAWQGLRLDVPGAWNPVRIDGKWEKGYILLADLERARLGIRWRAVKPGGITSRIRAAMLDEVGQLATDEAVGHPLPAAGFEHGLLYLEPEPPGRDVWVGYSRTTERLVQFIHHARRPTRTLPDKLLPTLVDQPPDRPVGWSIFTLSCMAPPGARLLTHKLDAGNQSLTFATGRNREATVRQIRLAHLALARQPFEHWFTGQQWGLRKQHRLKTAIGKTTVRRHGRVCPGLRRTVFRRRRFWWARHLPWHITGILVHDAEQDRLIFGQAPEPGTARRLVKHVGWAEAELARREKSPKLPPKSSSTSSSKLPSGARSG